MDMSSNRHEFECGEDECRIISKLTKYICLALCLMSHMAACQLYFHLDPFERAFCDIFDL